MVLTNREVYEAALALLSEEQDGLSEDYERRAGYLIGVFICECRDTDGFYRLTRGLSEAGAAAEAVDLDDLFPLSDRFFSAAAYYVAAMLTEIENPDLSNYLYAHYARDITAITQGIGGVTMGIKDVYGFHRCE